MKRNLLHLFAAVLTLCCSGQVAAQSQKQLVLIEEFTNTGCGPCATWSPVLDACIYQRLGDCIAIKYHTVYPYSRDEFYLAEQEDMQTRVDYYHVVGVPDTYINGTPLGTRTTELLNQAIDYCMAQPSDYTLAVSRQFDGRQLSVKAQLNTQLPSLATDNLRLFVAVIEEHITSTTPWPNGETEMNYVMRKMLTTGNGVALPAGDASGLSYTYDGQWSVNVEADLGQLGVVAFLQDISTRQVLATAYAGPDAGGDTNVTLLSLTGTPDHICLPNYYGQVEFRNEGANPVTQATLNVRVNGIVKQYPWTGSLGYLERTTLSFDGFRDFPLSADRNEVEVWLSDINGTDAVSNTRASSFSNSVQATHTVQLRIYTDKKPEETTWRLYNSAGDVIREGGPYDGQARKFITVDLELTQDDCYQIAFLDAGGDGIKGANGNGYYQLFQVDEVGKATLLTQGDYDGAKWDVYFNLKNAQPTGISDVKRKTINNNRYEVYDLSGRPANSNTRLRIYDKSKKVITNP